MPVLKSPPTCSHGYNTHYPAQLLYLCWWLGGGEGDTSIALPRGHPTASQAVVSGVRVLENLGTFCSSWLVLLHE